MNFAVLIPLNLAGWVTFGLALALGLRHSLEADHVAAVSTFASHEPDPLRSSLLGASWGLGHSAALLVFGIVIALLRLELTPRVSHLLDFAVGVMLILLGLNVVRGLWRHEVKIHAHTHEHDGRVHSHLHIHAGSPEHLHQHRVLRVAGKPFLVGVVHGLAGTGAEMLIVVSIIPTLVMAVGYLILFSGGVIGGMMAMSLLMSLPGALAAHRARAAVHVVRLAAGLFSVGLGLMLAWSIGGSGLLRFVICLRTL
jgi:hypothetical protein